MVLKDWSNMKTVNARVLKSLLYLARTKMYLTHFVLFNYFQGTISMGINATELFDNDYEDEDIDYQ